MFLTKVVISTHKRTQKFILTWFLLVRIFLRKQELGFLISQKSEYTLPHN